MDMVDTLVVGIVSESLPWISLLVSVVVTIWLKETASNLVKGWAFLRNDAFSPGDNVYVDDEPAVIISISITETIFEITRDQKKIWRHVPNHRIDFIKLEKVIVKN